MYFSTIDTPSLHLEDHKSLARDMESVRPELVDSTTSRKGCDNRLHLRRLNLESSPISKCTIYSRCRGPDGLL